MMTRRRANSSPYSVKPAPRPLRGGGDISASVKPGGYLNIVLEGVFNDRLCVLIPML